MKRFLNNKLNILLLVILLTITSVGVAFVFSLFADKKVEAIRFVGLRQDEVEAWAKENDLKAELLVYEYEYSEDVAKDLVIFQSVKEGTIIKEPITLTISKGSNPDMIVVLPDLNGLTKADVEKWVTENQLTSVEYRYNADSKLAEGMVISIEPSEPKRSDKVIITLSSNTMISDPVKEGDDNQKVLIPDDLWGISENEFIAKLNALGFKNLKKSATLYYSDNVPKDYVYYYDDGKFALDRTIVYALCAGKVDVAATAASLKGLSVSKAVSTIEELNDLNAGLTLKTSATAGNIDNCTVSGKTISCTVGNQKATIPDNLWGLSEADFIAKLKKLGFENLKKEEVTYFSDTIPAGNVFRYDDGTYDLSQQINYGLSGGKADVKAIANELIGLTLNEANSKIDAYNKRNARITFSGSGSGKISSCTVANRAISCTLSDSPSSSTTTATIPGNLLNSTESNFLSKLSSLGFKNTKKADTTYFSSTIAAGNIYSYDDGTFETSRLINYALSCGAFDANKVATELVGKTKSEAQSVIAAYVARNAHVSLNVNGEVEGSNPDTLTNCTASGSSSNYTISCKLVKQPATPTVSYGEVPTADLLNYSHVGNTVEETWDRVKGYFDGVGFSDVSYTTASSSLTVGRVIKVTVNGVEASGSYPLDSHIVVVICNIRLN